MTDERVNMQKVKMLRMLKEKEICCNLSAVFSETMPQSQNLRFVCMSKSCHVMILKPLLFRVGNNIMI